MLNRNRPSAAVCRGARSQPPRYSREFRDEFRAEFAPADPPHLTLDRKPPC
jgi:hypothetical protein